MSLALIQKVIKSIGQTEAEYVDNTCYKAVSRCRFIKTPGITKQCFGICEGKLSTEDKFTKSGSRFLSRMTTPMQYVFFLKCCFEDDCIHPLCSNQQWLSSEAMTWFSGGPPLSYIPLPIPDPKQPWGNSECQRCKGVCHGHFLQPAEAWKSNLSPMCKPPSDILQHVSSQLGDETPSDDYVTELAKKTLLPKGEVIMWLDHLRDVRRNRKRGAQKAAATRRRRKKQQEEMKKQSLVQENTANVPHSASQQQSHVQVSPTSEPVCLLMWSL